MMEYGDIVPKTKIFGSKTGNNNKCGINVLLFGYSKQQCEQFLNVLKSIMQTVHCFYILMLS